MPKAARIWKYFNKIDEGRKRAACAYCKKQLSYKATSTNLKTHLKLKHFFAYKQLSKGNIDPVSDGWYLPTCL